MSEKHKIFKYPIFRGVGTLFQAMSLGMKALKFSADVSLEDVQKEEKKKGKEAKEVPGWVLAGNSSSPWPCSSSCTSSFPCTAPPN